VQARWDKRHVRAGGLDVHVATRGEGDGTPLLLVTGIGAHLEMWGPLADALDGRELIAFDAPGTGRSPRPRTPMRMRGLAEHVTRLLDTLGHERVDALGYSFGGALVQELAHRAPGRVRRLVLCATAPGLGSVPPRPVAGLLLVTPARYYHPLLFRAIVPRIAGGRTARDPATLTEQAAARLAHPPSLAGYAFQLYAAAGWTSLPWLHRLPQPTLVVAGDDDPVIPLANARLLARRIPDARLHVVAGGGHLLLLDEPEAAAPEIQAFLSG
jgi:poly(3-hydroxyalkanoate) depolymerase